MGHDEARIRWAPKVRQEKIWRLYHNAALGLLDEELIAAVGWGLYWRCQSVLMVGSGQVQCPVCGAVFSGRCGGATWVADDAVLQCPQCTWQTTGEAYHCSWRHRDLVGTNDGGAFSGYVGRYPAATSARERLLLIDDLLHRFHQMLKNEAPHRSVAHNLIEGSHRQVVALLDRLTYGVASAPELHQTHAEWQVRVATMARRRDGERQR